MRTKALLSFIFIAGVWNTPASTEECSDRLTPNSAAKDVVACLKELSASNAQIKTRLDSKTENGAGDTELPAGAVVAFDLPTGCPKGWTAFEPATSRTIIGALSGSLPGLNLSARPYREIGGKEIHQLTPDELPPLKFSISVTQAGGAGGDRYNAGGSNYPVVTLNPGTVTTNSIGADAPFSTMPPFISLFYCKKG